VTTNSPADSPTTRKYPLPPGRDSRFGSALIVEVVDVLKAHGYPEPGGSDLADLVAALRGFLYAPHTSV